MQAQNSKDKLIILEEEKTVLLSKINILLLSDNDKDYKGLIEYGFKNIDHFKSVIRADKYFEQHPEELEKYHVLINSEQNVQQRQLLSSNLKNLKNNKGIIRAYLNRNSDYDFITTCFINESGVWYEKYVTFSELLDDIFEYVVTEQLLEKDDLNKEFQPIDDYVNPNRLPLPIKKSDLKILYLDYREVNDKAHDIANKLGLNITFVEDVSISLERYVMSNLGEYDIIIASNFYSSSILEMNNESTEQCKDTGRDLTLLMTYQYDHIGNFDENANYDNDGIGDKVILKYIFGGKFAKSNETQGKGFRVLRQSFESIYSDNIEKSDQSKKLNMQAIIEEAVHTYNDALGYIDKPLLTDLDLKSAETYDKEYITFDGHEQQRNEIDIILKNIKYTIEEYMEYRKQGLIMEEIKEFKVAAIKNVYDNLQAFELELAFCRHDCGISAHIEGCMNAFLAIKQEVDKYIVPLIEQVRKRNVRKRLKK